MRSVFAFFCFHMVGMTGFEPATPSSRTKCTTKLCSICLLYTSLEEIHEIKADGQMFHADQIGNVTAVRRQMPGSYTHLDV